MAGQLVVSISQRLDTMERQPRRTAPDSNVAAFQSDAARPNGAAQASEQEGRKCRPNAPRSAQLVGTPSRAMVTLSPRRMMSIVADRPFSPPGTEIVTFWFGSRTATNRTGELDSF